MVFSLLGKRKDGVFNYAPNILFSMRSVLKKIPFHQSICKDNEEQDKGNTISMKPKTTVLNMSIEIRTLKDRKKQQVSGVLTTEIS